MYVHHVRVLNYSNTDGNINMLPLLQRIIEHKIPVWVFR
jgi:serine carboxypeptidase-like clade 2